LIRVLELEEYRTHSLREYNIDQLLDRKIPKPTLHLCTMKYKLQFLEASNMLKHWLDLAQEHVEEHST
jgi:hypothetical protein